MPDDGNKKDDSIVIDDDKIIDDDKTKNDDNKTKSEVTDSQEFKDVVKESMKRKERLKDMDENLIKATDALTDTKRELSEFKDRFKDIDPEAVRKLMSDKKDSERKELESKGEYQRILDQVNDEHEAAIVVLKDRIENQEKEFAGKLARALGTNRELTIGRNFSDSEFVREELTLTPSKARQIYGTHFEVNDEGQTIAYDKPLGAAERAMIVDGKGKPASFADAIKKIVESDPEHDQLIRSKLKPGSNSKTDKKTDAPTEELTGMAKIRAGLKNLPASDAPNL